MGAEEFFETCWPAELPRLRRTIAGTGIAPQDVDDVVQEVAVRLYACWGRVFQDRPLGPLLHTIAVNTARDFYRRSDHRARPVPAVPESAMLEATSVERVVLARLEVAQVGRALRGAPTRQRELVARAVSEELAGEQLGRHRAAAATRMALSRARRQLAAAAQVAEGVIAICCGWTRRRSAPAALPGIALTALGLVVVVGALLWNPGPVARGRPALQVAQPPAFSGAIASTGQLAGSGRFGWTTASAFVPIVPGNTMFSGSGQWASTATWPYVALSALGQSAQAGPQSSQPPCQLGVPGLITVTYRCPGQVPAAR